MGKKFNKIRILLRILLKTAEILGGFISPFFINHQKVKRLKNINYKESDEKALLDLYLPIHQTSNPMPLLLFIHGGGFSFFSKDSHAAVASKLAEKGCVVFSINYRLAPQFPFPAGLSDSLFAYDYLLKNAEKYNGDLNKITVIGESAGGNFSLSLCLYLYGIADFKTSEPLPELKNIEKNLKPKHAIIHCGHLEVSSTERYFKSEFSYLTQQRVQQVFEEYLPDYKKENEKEFELANPLTTLEKLDFKNNENLFNDFPKVFIPVGSKDPVKGDSYRLENVLKKLNISHLLKTYEGETHAFYALVMREKAKECIEDIFHFIG